MEESRFSTASEPERPKLVRRSSMNEFKRQDSITRLANTLMWADKDEEDETSRDAFDLVREHGHRFGHTRLSTTSQCSSILEEETESVGQGPDLSDLDDIVITNEISILEEKGFVLDPEGDVCYVWLGVVTVAVLYNFWTIIFRTAFKDDIEPWESIFTAIDYLVDFIYLVDVFVQFHVGYLEHGILVRDQQKLRDHYRSNPNFKKDIIALFPSVILRLFYSFPLVIARMMRLMKLPSLVRFGDMADSRTSFPNRLRVLRLLIYLSTVIHWVACFQYMLSEYEGFGSNNWVYPALEGENALLLTKYIKCLYWSLLTLTAIGETPNPETNLEYIINGMTFLVGVMIFAAVVGNVGDVISNMNAARMDFQSRMDCIKQYMNHRGVPEVLQRRVKKWLDYSWTRTQALDEASLLSMLPGQLRAEIAIHVHLETLKKVDIFANCERGFLCELVLKLRSQIFSPGDYICREGEVGREMYIINHGKVECIIRHKETNEREVVRTLKEGNYFGEISLLKLDGGCNKRTADIRSVGYSELFILSKKDLLQALHYYPEAKEILEKLGRERLESHVQSCTPDLKDRGIGSPLPRVLESVEEVPKPIRSPSPHTSSKNSVPSNAELLYLNAVIRELKSFDSLNTQEKISQLSAKVESLEKELEAKKDEFALMEDEINCLKKKRSADKRRSRQERRQSLAGNPPNGMHRKEQPKPRRDSSPGPRRKNVSIAPVPAIRIIGPSPHASPLPVPKIMINSESEDEGKLNGNDDVTGNGVTVNGTGSGIGRKMPVFNHPGGSVFGSSLTPKFYAEDLGLSSACNSEFESDSDFLMSD
eukprot:m.201722 g.201722  ORF g.201722 m.201722 type:complete len:821 (+) comp39600_c0_seq46:347-2809(+)